MKGPGRRQFIKRTLATTGTLWLTTASGQLEIHDRRQIDSKALKKLRAQLKGGLILPTDPGYEAARRVYFWNPDTRRRRTVCPRRWCPVRHRIRSQADTISHPNEARCRKKAETK